MDPKQTIESLLKRVHISDSVFAQLSTLLPSDSNDCLSRTAIRPLSILPCPETNKPFLCCEFNAHLGSFRSPHSNSYVPSVSGPVPSRSLRELELKALALFADYSLSFYHNAVSSVFVKETSERSYAMCFAVKKTTDQGSTDAVHVVDLLYDGHHKILFKLTTKLLVRGTVKGFVLEQAVNKAADESLNRTEVENQELVHMIKMIENMEGNLKKSTMNFIQSKPMQVCNACRFFSEAQTRKRDRNMLKSLWGDQSKTESEENKFSD
jgi:capping protein (actin filament) muscle Z-line, beta